MNSTPTAKANATATEKLNGGGSVIVCKRESEQDA